MRQFENWLTQIWLINASVVPCQDLQPTIYKQACLHFIGKLAYSLITELEFTQINPQFHQVHSEMQTSFSQHLFNLSQ